MEITVVRRRTASLKPWVSLVARLVVGGVWVWAGLAKLTDPYGSAQAVRAYQLLPWQVADFVGHVLPSVEIVVGLALIFGVLTRAAAVASGLLLIAFIIGIASVWSRGILIDCGCFGGGGADPNAASRYPWEIARDAGLLVLSAYLMWAGAGWFALDNLLFARSEKES